MTRRKPMFRCTTHVTPVRPTPPDEPFVFEPDAHDINTLTGGIVGDLVDGGHVTFAMTLFGREVVLRDEVPLMDVIWDLPRMTDALDTGSPPEIEMMFHQQGGLILTLTFTMAGDDVIVTGDNPTGEFIPRGTDTPTERKPRATLAAELRKVAGAVLAAGVAIGSEHAGHPMVKEWAKQVKIPIESA